MSKQCGDCSLCCKLLDIPELSKPRGAWCSHVILKRGCKIYEDRPQGCRSFQCRWLTDDRLDERWKPNRCKLLLVQETPLRVVAYVDPGVKQPWLSEPFLSTLRQMSAAGLAAGGMVMVVENEETIVILPDREVRLGRLEDDDHIVLVQGTGRIDVKVEKEDAPLGAVGLTRPPS